MIDRTLLLAVEDQDSLVELLQTREEKGGLGWPVDADAPFQMEPEIAAGVKGSGQVTVSRLIPASADRERLVLLAEFERPYVRRDLRELLGSVRRHIRTTGRFADHTGFGDTLFIVAAPDYEDVRFVLFEERERRLPRIRSFGWHREFVGRTVLTHNLGRLLWSDRLLWEKAWDVEGLTDEFYNEFVKVFDAVKAATTHPGSESHKYAYVQQLLNRLLFIAFIERMGWLKTPEGSSDYLHIQWLRYNASDRYTEVQDKGLIPATFNGLLGWLFFNALDAPDGVKPDDRMYPLLGEVPYLNGGLFSEESDLDVPGVTVADEAFELLLGDRRAGLEGGLFRRFNFTVTESTPLDQEVAVDPEMLGKIFERIIVAEERHRTGTYYTPRPIVEFMVNEALKGYLTERGLAGNKAALLVDEDTVESDTLSFRPSEMQDTLDWLFEVRAVDPACGSGAYLLMLLQRLFELTDRLEVVQNKRRNPDQKHLYNTKLRLLERCVYGVDKSEVAVRIARLRLWLSLVVENRGEKPEPLPSFDFLIMCGDSLASPVKPDQHTLGHPHDAIREYTRMKRRYFHPAGGETRPARAEMKARRAEIAQAFDSELANSRLRSLAANPFDWEVDFAEVFDPQESEHTVGGRLNVGAAGGRHGQAELPSAAARPSGFDIVVANPPYVNSSELLKSVGQNYKDALVRAYPDTGVGTADLLVFFLDRALTLLQSNGHLAFITSNKWLKATYGKKLKAHLAANAVLSDLINFHDGKVFQGVTAYPLITIAQKGRGAAQTRYTDIPRPERDSKTPDPADYRKRFGHLLPQAALGTDGEWRLESDTNAERLTQMRTRGVPLGEYVKGKIYRGILTGLNEVKIGDDGRMYGKTVPSGVRVARKEGVFVIDGAKRRELIDADPNSAEIIKPLAIGRDVRRWVVEDNDRWLIVTKIGVDMTRYPAVMRHLEKYKEKLVPRADQGEHWWELRSCTYYNVFEGAAVCYLAFQVSPAFALKPAGVFTNNAVFNFGPGNNLFILGVMNSSSGWREVQRVCPAIQNGHQLIWDQLKDALLPIASNADRATIETLVSRMLNSKSADPNADVSELEAEIDRRVEFLYFHADEAPTYDAWMAKREAERGTVVAEIRNLIAGGENDRVEFKESVAWDVRQDKYSLTMRDEVLKEICAFLNAEGGAILCGVHDTEGVKGLRKDLKHTGGQDKLGLLLTNALGDLLRPHPVELVRMRFVDIDGETILRIDVQADPTTRYESPSVRREDAGKNLPRTHVRMHGSAKALEGQDLINWWLRRKQSETGKSV